MSYLNIFDFVFKYLNFRLLWQIHLAGSNQTLHTTWKSLRTSCLLVFDCFRTSAVELIKSGVVRSMFNHDQMLRSLFWIPKFRPGVIWDLKAPIAEVFYYFNYVKVNYSVKKSTVDLPRDFLIDGWCIGTFFLKLSKSWNNLNSFHLHIGKNK